MAKVKTRFILITVERSLLEAAAQFPRIFRVKGYSKLGVKGFENELRVAAGS